ncbi:methyl-accepting chemotaxis (MCP) signaling domain protein, partial [Vibrio parahaemolyticus V-223/04]
RLTIWRCRLRAQQKNSER